MNLLKQVTTDKIESAIERMRNPNPGKEILYRLKQPMKYAETGISAPPIIEDYTLSQLYLELSWRY